MIQIFWSTFSSVFFNSKTGLFSCIFWFEDSFLCKFTYLHLLSRLQGRIHQKNIWRPKKYSGLTNVSFQCHTSSWITTISIRKWCQNITQVSGSPILLPSKNRKFTRFPPTSVIFVKFWNHFLKIIGLFQDDVCHWNELSVNPKYFFWQSYIFWRILSLQSA